MADVDLYEQIRGSELWQRMHEFLVNRREAMLAVDVETNEASWKRMGAIRELTYLLNMPLLLTTQEQVRRENAAEARVHDLERLDVRTTDG